ncbi:hypothetical protein SAMN02745220_02894 [Desulfopila aestuarii DSM 18488]|uniref:Uncharacterized protein n=1 Tax=Desulfopila aestuarii DSM 18488 TaxID=1121416 RepID=A0A1M7YAB2_9BACT|nr:hypothetical protein SAMN02745220_02894 [Desulfopila aestuarii DSM 18488]
MPGLQLQGRSKNLHCRLIDSCYYRKACNGKIRYRPFLCAANLGKYVHIGSFHSISAILFGQVKRLVGDGDQIFR